MRKIGLVLKREYISRVTKRSFLITTLVVPFLMLLLPVTIFLIARNNDAERIAVRDESGLYIQKLQDSRLVQFFYESMPLDSLKRVYRDTKYNYDGVLYIPAASTDPNDGIKYFSSRGLGFTTTLYINSELSREQEKARLSEAGMTKDKIDAIKQRVSFETIIMTEEGESSDNKVVALTTAIIMGIIIYIILIIYGVMVMNGVVEEKANRIVEVIVSSVRPFEMLTGKILGVAAVGLTQLVSWIAIGALLFQGAMLLLGPQMGQFSPDALAQGGIKARDAEAITVFMKNLDSINFTELFFCFVFYFLGGYLFYAALYAAAASGANDAGDVQSLSFPVTIPVILSFFLLQVSVNDPHGPVAFWASMIPFSSPIVMLGRIPFGVPWWQLALSMSLLIAGFLSAVWVAGRIYRIGILMYGKKITLPELAKWMFYKG
ncbi:MAG TPA: ABC transporter permease [bacterium]|nr:ABC transporter permease [bacterium]HMW36845.1 ABC transporter permease [bacterium]HMY36171.1 ABC transporter permease [bacterium]HMZ03426.1 ABC transporter permease [bacterium]HNB08711.1 ABC transporter permease [bacterium]